MSGARFITGIGDEAAAGLDAQIACHRTLGWRELELRSIDGTPLAQLDAVGQDRLCATLAQSGCTVPVFDSTIGNWSRTIASPFEADLAELDTLLDLAGRTGTRMIRVMSYPNLKDAPWPEEDWALEAIRRMRILAGVAGARGVTLVHENCAGWGGMSIARALRLVHAVDDPYFRLLFDIGNGLSYGYDALDYLEQLLPWVAHVHIKDGRVEDGKVVYTMPGEGDAGVQACLRHLAAHGYAGGYAIEPHLHLIPHLRSVSGDGAQMQSSYQVYARQAQALVQDAFAAQGECHAA